ncbi:MAG TPA: helix-turn-helix transcriptional regulator, partial [Thermoleophilia bacterium]
MRDEHQETIGGMIAQLRERQGWSQRQLAKWVGLDQSAVSRIEASRRQVSAKELQLFADSFHVSADALLEGLPGGAPGPSTLPASAAPDSPPARGSMSYSQYPDVELVADEMASFRPIADLEAGPQAHGDIDAASLAADTA